MALLYPRPEVFSSSNKNTSPSSNMSEDVIKERIITALEYQYDGVAGAEENDSVNKDIAARLKRGNIQLG